MTTGQNEPGRKNAASGTAAEKAAQDSAGSGMTRDDRGQTQPVDKETAQRASKQKP